MQLFPRTEEEWKKFRVRVAVYGVILGLGAFTVLGFTGRLMADSFLDPKDDMTLSSAYVAYIVIMLQVAFRMVRKFSTRKEASIRSMILLGGWILATLAVLDATFDWGPLSFLNAKTSFVSLVVSSVVTLINTVLEGYPRPATGQTSAWAWKPAPWESTTPSGSGSASTS